MACTLLNVSSLEQVQDLIRNNSPLTFRTRANVRIGANAFRIGHDECAFQVLAAKKVQSAIGSEPSPVEKLVSEHDRETVVPCLLYTSPSPRD